MKDISSKFILFIADILAIALSVVIAYQLRLYFESSFATSFSQNLLTYLTFSPLYIVTLSMLAYEGIYTKRYDFWHESRQVLKAISLAFLLILAYLALTRTIEQYSRSIIVFIFFFMAFFIPLFKNITKKKLYKAGLWRREAKIFDNSSFISNEIYKNPYLGYIESSNKKAKTVFINSKSYSADQLKKIIDQEIRSNKEVIFIPFINEYNLSQSNIYELFNTRTNLIVLKNRLKSKYRLFLHNLFNYLLAITLLPVLLPVIAILAYLIKRESPGPIFFAHMRIGKDGKKIPTLKFRSMFQDANERLEKLLEKDPLIKEEWERNFKLRNDPRVTKVGIFLRQTSLDELPQIFNVLKGEMSFVGPRPVLQKEIDQYYKEDAQYYFMVKPGITGLWQVSGRSDTDYDFRVATDKWYVLNWSLWLDVVILVKTIKVVLKREGAY